MNAYVVKEGISGDGYSIKGVYLDYQLARELIDKLIDGHYCRVEYCGDDYWSGAPGDSLSYFCIMVVTLDEETG